MRTATLKLTLSPKKKSVFTVSGDTSATFAGPTLAEIERLQEKLSAPVYMDTAARARILRRHAAHFTPQGFATWFQQWIGDPDQDSILCVHARDARLAVLPWEDILLPHDAASGRGWVVRVCNLRGDPPASPQLSAEMLLAAWSGLTGFAMPGVQREMQELPTKLDKNRLDVKVLVDATRRQLLRACQKSRAAVVHLSPPSLIDTKGNLSIPTSLERAGTSVSHPGPTDIGVPRVDPVPVSAFTKALSRNDHLRMVVVNACEAMRGCEEITRDLRVIAVGWPFSISDDGAADFALYFYQRLLEGATPVLAVRSFAETISKPNVPVDIPVLWLPSPKWAAWRPLSGTEPVKALARRSRTARASSAGKRKPTAAPPVTGAADTTLGAPTTNEVDAGPVTAAPAADLAAHGVRLEFRPRASINPALLVNGLAPIEHLTIESPIEQEIHLCIECDTGADTSNFRQTVLLKQGTVPVATSDMHFPALHELIERHARRRRISFTATLTTFGGVEVASQTRTAQWMGAKEWLDQVDTWAFIPAFVNPFEDGILRVFELAERVLRTLGHPSDAFSGYQETRRAPEYVATQMKAIFQTLRDDSIGLTYISPPGSPIVDASNRVCGQVVRTHTEVVERKLGTCHDLSLLLAACAEYIGIRPLICLIPMHTFMGYWTTPEAQERYWKARESRLRTATFGERWTLGSGSELQFLVRSGQVTLIEATFVCQRQKTFEDACRYRTDRLESDEKNRLEAAIDIRAARGTIQPV